MVFGQVRARSCRGSSPPLFTKQTKGGKKKKKLSADTSARLPLRANAHRRALTILAILSMSYLPAEDRYDNMPSTGTSRSMVVQVPPISLGLCTTSGAGRRSSRPARVLAAQRVDLGVTTSTWRNNYGPRTARTEEIVGRLIAQEFRPLSRRALISTKAGWDMWPVRTASLARGKLPDCVASNSRWQRWASDYVDNLYSHRSIPRSRSRRRWVPLATAVNNGKARYVGNLLLTPPRGDPRSAGILRDIGTPLLSTRPSYSRLNRLARGDMLDTPKRSAPACHHVLRSRRG